MGNAEAEKAKVEQKLQTLQFQNGKLSAQLEVQRSQIAELETRIEAQDAKQSSYADTLLTVNSLWSQLNADIQHLGTRASKVCFVFQLCCPLSEHVVVHDFGQCCGCERHCWTVPCHYRDQDTRQPTATQPSSMAQPLQRTHAQLRTRTCACCCTAMPLPRRYT